MNLSSLLFATILGVSSSFTPLAPMTSRITSSAIGAADTVLEDSVPDLPSMSNERSPAIPFLPYPQKCKGYAGDIGFDPWGFSNNYEMDYLREAELKHGRVCMMAWVGWVAVDNGLRVYPVPEGWANLSSLEAWSKLQESPMGWLYSPLGLFTLFIGIIEMFQLGEVNKMLRGDEKAERVPGDLDLDILKLLKDKSDEEVMEMKTKEVLHCRLGMLAFSGVVAQSIVMGSTSFPYLPIVN